MIYFLLYILLGLALAGKLIRSDINEGYIEQITLGDLFVFLLMVVFWPVGLYAELVDRRFFMGTVIWKKEEEKVDNAKEEE